MEMQEQVQLAAEHARSIINEILTHKDPAVRLALLGPYHFAFQREYGTAEVTLRMQELNTQRAESKSVPAQRPKLSVIKGGR